MFSSSGIHVKEVWTSPEETSHRELLHLLHVDPGNHHASTRFLVCSRMLLGGLDNLESGKRSPRPSCFLQQNRPTFFTDTILVEYYT